MAPAGAQSVYSRSMSSPLSRALPPSADGVSITIWKIPVESPVSLKSDGSGSNELADQPLSPMVRVEASESHSIRSRSHVSDSSDSKSRSGSIKVMMISLPMM